MLNQLQLLDDKFGLDEIPIQVFHDGQKCSYTFQKLSIDITDDRKVKEIQLNITKNGRYPKYSEE
ncbi:MAG: hypothetical protein ACRCW1_08130 [Anaerotignaceae bacterium]